MAHITYFPSTTDNTIPKKTYLETFSHAYKKHAKIYFDFAFFHLSY